MAAAPSKPHAPQVENLTAVVRQHQAFVWRYLRFLGCDHSLADDLTQETFVQVFGKPRRIDPKAMRSYLRRVAANLFRKARHRQRKQVELVDETVAEVAFDMFCGQDDGDGYLLALRQCLTTLDDRSRQAVHLRYHDGLQRGEIGLRLELQDSGVKSLLQRSLARLRECVRRRMA